MKRWILGVVLIVVVGIGVGVFVLSNNLNEVVRAGIESQGSAALGTSVRVGAVELHLREGRGLLRDLRIENPKGSGPGTLLALGSVMLDIDTASALDVASGSSNHFVIEAVSVEDPRVAVIVAADGSTNVQALQDAMARRSPSGGGASSAPGDSDPLLLTLEQVSMARAAVTVDTTAVGGKQRDLTLPDFAMRNVGGGAGSPAGDVGATVAQGFAKRLTTVLVSSAASSQLDRLIDKKLGGETGKAAKGLLKQMLGGN